MCDFNSTSQPLVGSTRGRLAGEDETIRAGPKSFLSAPSVRHDISHWIYLDSTIEMLRLNPLKLIKNYQYSVVMDQ